MSVKNFVGIGFNSALHLPLACFRFYSDNIPIALAPEKAGFSFGIQ
jgi:hypothetical protein